MSKTIINSKIVTLNGISKKIEFNETFKNFAVNNHGEDSIYVSMSPISDISADGVSAILPYDSVCTLHGSDEDTVYLYGTGEAEVRGVDSESNPFKNSLRGGEKALKESISGIEENVSDIQGYMGYTDSDILGLEADFENNRFTRLAGAIGKNGGSDFDVFPMYGGRRRCLVSDEGRILAFYDTFFKADFGTKNWNDVEQAGYIAENFTALNDNGEFANLPFTGNVQVMVYQPKFYYKVVPLKLEPIADGIGYHLRKARYYISASPKPGFKLHPAFYSENGKPVDYILFSAYEGSVYDVSAGASLANDEQVADFTADTGDKLSSIAGVKPCSGASQNLTCNNAEMLAKNRGAGWHIDTIKTVSANQLLMIIEYGTFNMQAAIGMGIIRITDDGVSNLAHVSGTTSSVGNATGTVSVTNGLFSVSYRGMENPWGNIWKLVNGINIFRNNKNSLSVRVCKNYDFNSENSYDNIGFTPSQKPQGYISAFGFSKCFDWLFLPSETIGNSNLPVGDEFRFTEPYNDVFTITYGGAWTYESAAGIFLFQMRDCLNYHYRITGARTIFVPEI